MDQEDDDVGPLAVARPNEFTFNMVGLSNMKFDITDHSITANQAGTWHGITKIDCGDKGCTLTVKAGRKASKDVAEWFKAQIKPGSAIGCASYDTLPGELNFAFTGTMSFDHKGRHYVGEKIVLAQGHSGRSRNNWWIGGPNLSQITNVPIVHLAAAAQTFYYTNIISLPAKVTFVTFLEQVSSMNMGVIDL
jgi:1-phosphatidylinositol phosphodiesterase